MHRSCGGSHKINRMSPHSNAAEQAAASAASHGTVWMRSFCIEIGIWDSGHRAPLYCDNNGVVGIANDTTGRMLLQSACEDPYTQLDEVDRAAEDELMLRDQAAISIRGLGHTADGQGYADFQHLDIEEESSTTRKPPTDIS